MPLYFFHCGLFVRRDEIWGKCFAFFTSSVRLVSLCFVYFSLVLKRSNILYPISLPRHGGVRWIPPGDKKGDALDVSFVSVYLEFVVLIPLWFCLTACMGLFGLGFGGRWRVVIVLFLW